MLKNIEGKEVDSFEQAMEYRIAYLIGLPKYEKSEYSEGQRSGFEYALAVYRDCVGGEQ